MANKVSLYFPERTAYFSGTTVSCIIKIKNTEKLDNSEILSFQDEQTETASTTQDGYDYFSSHISENLDNIDNYMIKENDVDIPVGGFIMEPSFGESFGEVTNFCVNQSGTNFLGNGSIKESHNKNSTESSFITTHTIPNEKKVQAENDQVPNNGVLSTSQEKQSSSIQVFESFPMPINNNLNSKTNGHQQPSPQKQPYPPKNSKNLIILCHAQVVGFVKFNSDIFKLEQSSGSNFLNPKWASSGNLVLKYKKFFNNIYTGGADKYKPTCKLIFIHVFTSPQFLLLIF